MTVSVVTGSSTGIGYATALRLAKDGHQVHASVRSEASGAALLEAAGGLDLQLLIMDVDDDASVASALGAVVESTGVDVLVNNAGIAKGHAIEETSMADFQATMNTNVWGIVRCVQAVLPSMRERGSGRIVNVTSAAGRLANPSQGAYCMSKWAAEAYTEVLAGEVKAFGIRVTAIEPGVIMTPIFEKAMTDLAPDDSPYPANQQLGEWFMQSLVNDPLDPEAVADVISEVVATEHPKLRYLVGPDAESIVAYRESVTDEEWVAFGAMDYDAWWTKMTEISGIPRPG
jgi:NAD(P)-dependent dehydrogenase (short-subunit alcohol dehydrogenase family)